MFSPTTQLSGLLLRLFLSIVLSVLALVLAHKFLRLRGRRALIAFVTFIAGLFFALEFFYPTHLVEGKQKNFLTDYIEPATIVLSVIGAFTVGLAIYSLTQVPVSYTHLTLPTTPYV